MKQLFALLITIAIFSNCSKNHEADSLNNIRLIAWEQLSDNEKSTVITEWINAQVNKTMYNNKNVYAVTFNTTQDPLLGPIIIYIDKMTKEVLGRALRF